MEFKFEFDKTQVKLFHKYTIWLPFDMILCDKLLVLL